jgi:CBS domain-containing protein
MSVDDDGAQPDSSEHNWLAALLSGIEPFGSLQDLRLRELAEAATVQEFAMGELVVDAFDEPPTEIFVILDGSVDVWHDAERVNHRPDGELAAGSVIGFSALLTERPVGPRVVANAPTRVALLPGILVEPAFQSRSGARFLAHFTAHTRSISAT